MPGDLSVLSNAAKRLSTSVIWDRSRGHAWLPNTTLINMTPQMMLAGPVFPVLTRRSILPVLQGIQRIPAHHVLIVADESPPHPPAALLGDIIMLAASQNGVSGILCLGWVRDIKEADVLGMPLWAHGVTVVPAPLGERAPSVPETVYLGGRSLAHGDWIFGDRDGLVVVPAEHARNVITGARIKEKKERIFKERMRSGERLDEMMELDGHLEYQAPLKVEF